MDKSTEILHYSEWQCGDNVLKFVKPLIMGILNLTPDSFFDGGAHNSVEKALKHTEKLIEDGADIIDLGAVSTRPGADNVDSDIELQRMLPVLKLLINEFPKTVFSIDTFRSEVVRASYNEGAGIINDISAGSMDEKMTDAVAETGLPYILMHMQGTPRTMQTDPYYDDVVDDVGSFFERKIKLLAEKGIRQVAIDPGFGFGKTLEDNYRLLKELRIFTGIGFPILAGLSRKSMIHKVVGTENNSTLTGTIALNMLALHNGASILRVHDVKEAADVIKIFSQLRNS